MITKKLYLDYSTLKSSENTKKLIEFCGAICSDISFNVHLSNYNFTANEYKIACNDIYNYYMKENEVRRNDYFEKEECREKLLKKHHTTEQVREYFDRLMRYDMIEFEEVKMELKRFIKSFEPPKHDEIMNRDIENQMSNVSLPTDNFLSSNFTFISHCTIGGLYKSYKFRIDDIILKHLAREDKLFKFYLYKDTKWLEDPAFFDNDKLILSICSHDKTATLFLSVQQYNDFKFLEIPHECS